MNSPHRPPPFPAVKGIIAVNLFIYVAGIAWSAAMHGSQFRRLTLNASEGVFGILSADSDTLLRMGAASQLLVLDQGQVWRLVISSFLHAGLLHIGMNMGVLYQIGRGLEYLYGRPRFIVIYFFSGFFGMLCSLPFLNGNPTVGASAAIMGLLGSALVYGFLRRDEAGRRIMRDLLKGIGFILLLGLLVPEINNAGHIAGAVTGALLTLGFGIRPIRDPRVMRLWRVTEAACIALFGLSLVMMAIQGDRGWKRKPVRWPVRVPSHTAPGTLPDGWTSGPIPGERPLWPRNPD